MRKAVLVVAFAAVLAPGLFAEPAWKWFTSVGTVLTAGDTRYLMEEPGSPYGVSSELIFPLETLLGRVTVRGERTGDSQKRLKDWSFDLSLAVNVLAPFGLMQDFDWLMYLGTPKVPISYTESDAGLTWLELSAAWSPVVASGNWGSLAVAVGLRFHYVNEQAFGYNGWLYEDTDTDGQPELFTQTATGLVLTYRVLWSVPTAGLSVALRPAEGVNVKAEAGAAVPYAADEDDHVLRHKLSKASGLGIGGYAELAARYTWGKARSRAHPYLSLTAGLLALKADTKQTQTYYSGATEYPAGTTWSGIDHQISTVQFSAALAGGVTY
jgi:hypothetical protein